MFVDEADIHVQAGNGGSGCVSFRREKYVPKGGPDGGDGGRGGSVILVADPNKDTLMDFAGKHHWNAPNGQGGMGKKMAGLDGEDLIVPVPVGTLIYDADHGMRIADLNRPGKRSVVARAGKGGLGNWHFRSAVNQVPRYAEPGTLGQERRLHLELKLIADVGFVGMPNAGKSTLLRAVSAARPKVADYPFTTLDPQLGIAILSGDRRIVMADIPGLIEGAQHGAGLGVAFLKHVERTKIIVHLLDLFPSDGSDPAANYRIIRGELEAFSPELAAKREVIAANKVDLAVDNDALDHLKADLPGKEIFAISGSSHQGVQPLLERLWQVLQEEKAKQPVEAEEEDEPAEEKIAAAPVAPRRAQEDGVEETPEDQESLLEERKGRKKKSGKR
ncbi:MAG TPA: GTPase ObgE [Tepidisphaeraceae bacterium]|jgi:GTP-binding protein|nr:GTPase ObgE [Tepidisphaeraceae bacterium]